MNSFIFSLLIRLEQDKLTKSMFTYHVPESILTCSHRYITSDITTEIWATSWLNWWWSVIILDESSSFYKGQNHKLNLDIMGTTHIYPFWSSSLGTNFYHTFPQDVMLFWIISQVEGNYRCFQMIFPTIITLIICNR